MTDTGTEPDTRRREPVLNAPGLVLGLALGLVALHAIRIIAPEGAQALAFYHGALIPERFWAAPPASVAYDGPLPAGATLLSHAALHGGWAHVIMNTVMLLAVGSPVARFFGASLSGTLRFLAIFLGAVATGAVAHLATNYPVGPPAIGASGGVSGLIAAALLLAQGGHVLSRQFAVTALAFTVANIALIWMGPAVFGSGIAWQAHLGGFFGGALLFALLKSRA